LIFVVVLAPLSTRRCPVRLEPVGHRVEKLARSNEQVGGLAPVRFAATETAVGELPAADLSGLDPVALLIDGVHFGEHLCVVALGIGIAGVKHPLGLGEGSTENTSVVTDLLTRLRIVAWTPLARSSSASTATRRCALRRPSFRSSGDRPLSTAHVAECS